MLAELFQNHKSIVAPAIEEIIIESGNLVHFYDDETQSFGWATFVGVYQTLRGESSPYWGEHIAGVHRALVRETIINPDGSIIERPNYILLENIWHESEVNAYPFAS